MQRASRVGSRSRSGSLTKVRRVWAETRWRVGQLVKPVRQTRRTVRRTGKSASATRSTSRKTGYFRPSAAKFAAQGAREGCCVHYVPPGGTHPVAHRLVRVPAGYYKWSRAPPGASKGCALCNVQPRPLSRGGRNRAPPRKTAARTSAKKKAPF